MQPLGFRFDNSPRFMFDAISENLASLFGLTTPLNGRATVNLIGLGWGRILFVIALALAIWRLWRVGWRSRWLWVAVAAGATFWFISALAVVPMQRGPTASRYQYPGAIFVLLIAAELLRGARAGRRLLAVATAITVLAVASGVILLHGGYEWRTVVSDLVRARLAALDIARGHVIGNFTKQQLFYTTFTAPSYFSAADAFGTPAFSESQLAASGYGRVAEQVLVGAEAIGLKPVAPGGSQRAGAAGRCQTLNASQDFAGLAVHPGVYTLSDRSAQEIQLARFANGPWIVLGDLSAGSAYALSVPPDRSDRPWRLYSVNPSPVTVCRVGSPGSSSLISHAGSPPQQFRQSLMSKGALTSQQAGCIVNAMLAQLGGGQFDRLYGQGHNARGAHRLAVLAFLDTSHCVRRGPGK
jgi:hypothetical protein